MNAAAERPKRGLATKLGLALLAMVLAVGVAELACRLIARKPYERPRIVGWSREERDLSDIVGFLRETGAGAERTGPHSVMGANIVSRQCYDRPEWSYFDADGCIDMSTNSLGFRDLEFPLEKPAGELRILAVGDSFTFGNGVRLEDTWAQQLEKLLAARHPKVEVINAGFATGEHRPSGYGDWIEHDGLAFAPDVVLIGFCLNDMGSVPMAVIVKEPAEPWLGGKSLLLMRIQHELLKRKYADFPLDVARKVEREPAIWLATQAGLTRIRDLCAARGVRFVVAVFPMLSQLDGTYPFRRLHALVAEFCEREGIERVDLLERFLGRRDRELWAHPTDQHPNDVGHRLIAEGILEYLEKPP